MKLPYSNRAYVPRAKLTDYLLSESHPVGRSKAKFFRSLGFTETNVEQFENGLLALAQLEVVTEAVESQHGTKYVIDGKIETPRGIAAPIRTIWIIDAGQKQPRFVTAYPHASTE